LVSKKHPTILTAAVPARTHTQAEISRSPVVNSDLHPEFDWKHVAEKYAIEIFMHARLARFLCLLPSTLHSFWACVCVFVCLRKCKCKCECG